MDDDRNVFLCEKLPHDKRHVAQYFIVKERSLSPSIVARLHQLHRATTAKLERRNYRYSAFQLALHVLGGGGGSVPLERLQNPSEWFKYVQIS
jgi:hypothetical protein